MGKDIPAKTHDRTDYEIPDIKRCELDSLPALAGEGWKKAKRKQETESIIITYEDEEKGIFLKFIDHITGWLKELPKNNYYHVQERGEDGNSGHGKTFVVGDFYLDYRMVNSCIRRWNGTNWEGEHPEIRVRYRADKPEKESIEQINQKKNL